MDITDGFVPIVAMFYCLFHPTEGTKVVHQTPSGAIVPEPNDPSAMTTPLIDFDSIKNYVIPKPALCNRLVTFKINNYRVIGFPVNLYSSNYARNSFSFNFCLVFPYESDTTPYEGNVKRLGRMFRALEEQSQVLSKAAKNHEVFFKDSTNTNSSSTDTAANSFPQSHSMENMESSLQFTRQIVEDMKYVKIVDDMDELGTQGMVAKQQPGSSKTTQPKLSSISSLVEQIFQDLNNYSECLIPIEGANSVDIKLFPIFPPPPEINSCDVPIATVKLDSMVDPLWDPTMIKILPFINGINSIKKISVLADADYDLTDQCIQHLLHYKSVTILDIFQFSNSYAPTSQISNFLRDPFMASECQAYVVCASGTFNTLPLRPSRVSMSNSEVDGASINSSSLRLDKLSPMDSNNTPAQITAGSSGADVPHQHYNNSTNNNNNNNSNNNHSNNNHQQSFGISPQAMSNSSNAGGISSSYKHNHMRQLHSGSLSKSTKIALPSKATLFYLYRSMNQNMSIKQWYLENHKKLENIDIRRFVSFGVLRGLIYRVRSYPASTRMVSSKDTGTTSGLLNANDSKWIKNYNISSLPITNADNKDERDYYNSNSGGSERVGNEGDDTFVDLNELKAERLRRKEEEKLIKLLKKCKDFDLICTEMNKSKKEIMMLLNGMGDWSVINS